MINRDGGGVEDRDANNADDGSDHVDAERRQDEWALVRPNRSGVGVIPLGGHGKGLVKIVALHVGPSQINHHDRYIIMVEHGRAWSSWSIEVGRQ